MPKARSHVIGRNIEAIRSRLGYGKPSDFARALGVRPQRINDWEMRHEGPRPETLLRIAAFLRVPVDQFLVGINADYDRFARDLGRHSRDGKMSPSKEAVDVFPATETRVRELEAENAKLRAKVEADKLTLDGMQELLTARTGAANEAAKAPAPKIAAAVEAMVDAYLA